MKRKFLLIRLGKMGDILLDTPLIRHLKKLHEDAEIHFLTKQKYRGTLEGNPYLEKIWYTDPTFLAKFLGGSFLRKFDAVIDLTKNYKSAFLSIVSSKKRVCINKGILSHFYNEKIDPPYSSMKYTVFHRLALLSPFGFSLDQADPSLDFFVDESSKRRMEIELKKAGIDEFILFNVYSDDKLKLLPPQLYAWLADKVRKEFEKKVLFIWTRKNIAYVKKVLDSAKEEHFLSPPTRKIKELGALIQLSKFFFGIDSGPKHIAVSLRIPTFSIFTNADPLSWTPPDGIHSFYREEGCKPCWKKDSCPKGTMRCYLLDREKLYEKLKEHMLRTVSCQ